MMPYVSGGGHHGGGIFIPAEVNSVPLEFQSFRCDEYFFLNFSLPNFYPFFTMKFMIIHIRNN